MSTEGVAGMTDYQVRAKRWKHGWELHIDGLGVTQSRTLRDADAMVRDFVSLNTGLAEDEFDVSIIPDLGGLEVDVDRVRSMTREAERAQAEAAQLARATVRRMKAAGLSGADMAAVLGVSPQRVSQLSQGVPRT